MKRQVARVSTEKASRYLVQMCKHFAHKVPVDYDDRKGHVDFGLGTCVMQADDGLLVMSCEAASEPAMARVKLILEDHLTRFAWREEIGINWEAGGDGRGDGEGGA